MHLTVGVVDRDTERIRRGREPGAERAGVIADVGGAGQAGSADSAGLSAANAAPRAAAASTANSTLFDRLPENVAVTWLAPVSVAPVDVTMLPFASSAVYPRRAAGNHVLVECEHDLVLV